MKLNFASELNFQTIFILNCNLLKVSGVFLWQLLIFHKTDTHISVKGLKQRYTYKILTTLYISTSKLFIFLRYFLRTKCCERGI